MARPTWVPGQVLTASDVNNWFTGPAAIKTGTTSRASTTTPTNDPDLTIALASSASYLIVAAINYDGGTGGSYGGMKMTWAVPASANFQYNATRQNPSHTFVGAFTSIGSDVLSCDTTGVGSTLVVGVSGVITTAGTAGNLVFQWAQDTSSGTNTHVLPFSFLTAARIA